jgi:hypothetical protein
VEKKRQEAKESNVSAICELETCGQGWGDWLELGGHVGNFRLAFLAKKQKVNDTVANQRMRNDNGSKMHFSYAA